MILKEQKERSMGKWNKQAEKKGNLRNTCHNCGRGEL
jgi:ribosomal protein S14